jgi:ABC-type lipoprotein export system ATPase subunit
VFIEGPSGSGKSTLLGLLAGIVTPQAGQITALGRSLDAAHRKDFIELLFEECRREDTALVFVSHDNSLAPMFDHTVRLTEINRVNSSAEGQWRTS